MKTCLMVAEKPSLAGSLAKILSNNQMTTRKGSNSACSILEYTGNFPPTNEKVRFKFTSVCGHVLSLDFIGRYNNWDKVDPVELFKAQTQKKEATEKLQMPRFLEREARGCDYLVLWLDCDKEGENICFEVIDCVKNAMNRYHDKNVFRAKFSSITDKDILKAFQHLGVPNEDEALSVDARQELDLRIGCAFTRYQTKFFQGKYGDLDSTLISYGPCQTPTLGFCVERHDRIQSFKPEPYWVLQVQVTHPGGRTLTLDWERVRMFDKDVAQLFLNLVKQHKHAKVLDVTKKEKTKARPLALNTVEMLRMASTGLSMSPSTTMHIAERLYTQGYISYPRTETTSYPHNFDLKGPLKAQQNNSIWGALVRELLQQGMSNPRKGKDVGDHPPITPMRAASEAELGHDGFRLYELICRNFIATVSPDCRYLQTTAYLTVGKENFSLTGKTLMDPGFTAVMHWQAIPTEESMPTFKTGEEYPVSEAKLQDRQTSPPDYLTESELITLMEKHGIGTDASIPVHINNICERNYVTVTSGRRLKPTNLGIVLVHGYQKIDVDLVKPTMRAAVEEQLNLIAQGRADYHAVLRHAIDIFHAKFRYFVENILNMDELFEVSFNSLASTGKPLSKCGKCRRYMKLVAAKPTRMHCGTCDETYSMPAQGSIKLYKELKCPLDEFELVQWTAGGKGKSYVLCPFCYNNPPFPDMKKGQGCNECSHPTCQHSYIQHAVSNCVECENGVLVFDPSSAPKWRMACNKCNVVINFFENAHKIHISEDPCDECSSAILDVTFNKNKTPLENGETEHSGCVFCDTLFKTLVEMKHVTARGPRRGGGRGRGRGGRGRGGGGGRGRRVPKDKMSQLANYFV